MTSVARTAGVALLAEVWAYSPDVRLGQLIAHLGMLGEDMFDEGPVTLADDNLSAVLVRHLGELKGRQNAPGRPGEVAVKPSPDQRRMVEVFAEIWARSPDLRFGQLLTILGDLCRDHTGQQVAVIDDDEMELVMRLDLARLRRRAGDEEARVIAEAIIAST